MEIDLIPEQPQAVAEAVLTLLDGAESGPDPWWQAGLDEALEGSL
jgi:hypothetical protein